MWVCVQQLYKQEKYKKSPRIDGNLMNTYWSSPVSSCNDNHPRCESSHTAGQKSLMTVNQISHQNGPLWRKHKFDLWIVSCLKPLLQHCPVCAVAWWPPLNCVQRAPVEHRTSADILQDSKMLMNQSLDCDQNVYLVITVYGCSIYLWP